MPAIPVLYGADWCSKTIAIQDYFMTRRLDYHYVNVERSEEAMHAVKDMNRGKVRFPMVVIVDQPPLKNPSPETLDKALNQA